MMIELAADAMVESEGIPLSPGELSPGDRIEIRIERDQAGSGECHAVYIKKYADGQVAELFTATVLYDAYYMMPEEINDLLSSAVFSSAALSIQNYHFVVAPLIFTLLKLRLSL